MESLIETCRQAIDMHPYLAYLIILVWTFIEGETIVIFMGIWAAHNENPNVGLVIVCAFAGSLAGDQLWFYIGRTKGKTFIANRPSWQSMADRISRVLHRHQTWLILGFRFLYGLRNATPFVLGMSGVRPVRFLVLNTIGAAVWATTFAMGGYIFGIAIEKWMAHLKIPLIIGLVVVIGGAWLIRTWARHRKNKRMKAAAAGAEGTSARGADDV